MNSMASMHELLERAWNATMRSLQRSVTIPKIDDNIAKEGRDTLFEFITLTFTAALRWIMTNCFNYVDSDHVAQYLNME